MQDFVVVLYPGKICLKSEGMHHPDRADFQLSILQEQTQTLSGVAAFGVAFVGVSIVLAKELAVLAGRNIFIAEGMCMAIKLNCYCHQPCC